jgi:hypothetical protein
MGFNLTGTQVKNTYQRLAQISGSVLTNGTGSVITNLTVVASNATNAVNSLFAVTASYAAYAVSASHEIVKEVSSSYADTAGVANSVAYNRITGKPTLVSGSGQIVIGSTIGQLDGSRVEGAIAGTVAYANVTGKPTLVSGSSQITLSGTTGTLDQSRISGPITASLVQYSNVANKPTLVSGSSQISFTGISNKPTLVSGSSQISFLGLSNKSVGIVSGSSQITLASTTGTLPGDRISSAVANATAAVTATSASYALTASTAATATTATSSTNAQDILLYVRNTSGAIIPKGRVVRVTGATGDNPNIGLAEPTTDALSANTIGFTNEEIAINGFGYVMTQGRLLGVNTNSFTPGTNLYLAAGGTFSATPSTAPNHTVRLGQVMRQNTNNGSINVSIDNGYELTELHDVLISSPSGSGDLLQFDGTVWRNAKTLTGNYTFGGTQTFNNITVNGTGSFAYLISVTGSVKKIGDAFIQLNTDTPAERYAGIIVIDSGSAQTGSLIYDSQQDLWGYKAVDGHSSGFLSGPSSTLGGWTYPTQNKILKSLGTDHVGNSSITDTGTKVDFSTNVVVTGSVTASTGFVGNLSGNASTATSATTAGSATTATTASFAFVSDLANQATSASYVAGQENYARKDQANTFTQRNSFNNGINVTGSLTFNSTNTYDGIDLFQGVFPTGGYSTPIRFFSGSVKKPIFNDNKWINMQVTPGNLPWLAISSFPENDHFMYFQPAYTSPSSRNRIAFESQISGFGSGLQVNDNLNVTGSLNTRSAAPGANVSVGMINITGNQFVNIAPFATSTQTFNNSRFGFVNQTRGTSYRQAFAIENYNNTSYDNTTFGSGLYANGRGFSLDFAPSGSATSFTNRSQIILQQAGPGTSVAALSATNIQLGPATAVTTGVIGIGNASLPTINMTAASGSFQGVTNARLNNVRVNGVLNVNGNTALTGTLTVANKTTFNDQVVGSVGTITPSAGAATLDCSLGNFFTMTLAAGSNVLLTPSNIHAGQTINLQITQNGTTAGTITFPSTVKFTDGIDYVATTSLNAVDVITLVSFDGTNLLATAVKNLQ